MTEQEELRSEMLSPLHPICADESNESPVAACVRLQIIRRPTSRTKDHGPRTSAGSLDIQTHHTAIPYWSKMADGLQ